MVVRMESEGRGSGEGPIPWTCSSLLPSSLPSLPPLPDPLPQLTHHTLLGPCPVLGPRLGFQMGTQSCPGEALPPGARGASDW